MLPPITTSAETSETMEKALSITFLVLRIIAALLVIWYSSYATKKARLFSGYLTAIVCGFLSFTFLEPLFTDVGLDLGTFALVVLTVYSAFVGMSLGVLLPLPLPGACLGAAVTLILGIFYPAKVSNLFFPVMGGLLAAVGAILSRCCRSAMLGLGTALVGGSVAACFAMPCLFTHMMGIVRGDYNPDKLESCEVGSVTHDLICIVCCAVTAALIAYRAGHFRFQNFLSGLRGGYSSVSTNDVGGAPVRRKIAAPSYHRDPLPAAPEAYNMFDPADLPPRLAEYATMVYSACEDLGNFFGFQDSSVRNQAEHLLILLSNNRRYMSSHILSVELQPPSPIHALHAKVFSNYMKWCRAMSVPPNFSKVNAAMSAPPAVACRVVDLVLFFCIWGEGANIRHMPECMWFLYHKMMEEYTRSEGVSQGRSLYAGHYIDNIVAPIYEIVAANMKLKTDHQDKRNYDDFNEFFWSRNCLKYRYSSAPPGEATDLEASGRMNGPLPGDDYPSITEGLLAAPKTFLEKRSWLRGILAMNRIIEWHIVTFFLLAIIAFARELVWGWVFACQAASGVFWMFNALHLCWGLVEVWSVYPGIQLSGTAVCGFVFTLVARFLILVYQTLYLMWTFGKEGTYLGITADSNFWWWQYVWLSLLCMIPYFVEALLQFYPALSTKIYTSQNDYVQSFLNILFPLSRLYVAKELHETFAHTAVYIFFWLTLIVWKLFFSYVFEIYSMVLPTLELTDDYANYPDQSFAKMSIILFIRWLPQFIVYCIDMSIWYAAWQAFAGTSVGFSEHLGDIRSINDIRQNFGRAPEHFCKKMLSPDAGSRRGSSASFLGSSVSVNNIAGPEGKSLLGTDPQRLQSYVNRLLDVRIQKWVMFSTVWNDIIDSFREEDIISNRERDYLMFSRFDGFNQAIYLPVFQTAGVIENALSELERPQEEYKAKGSGIITDDALFKPILDDVTMRTAVSEVWELGSFLFLQLLGPIHHNDVTAVMNLILNWSEHGRLVEHVKMDKMRTVMKHFVDVIKTLEKGVSRRKPAAKARSSKIARQTATTVDEPQAPSLGAGRNFMAQNGRVSGGMRKAVSATSLNLLETDVKPTNEPVPPSFTLQKSRRKSSTEGLVIIDALRDQVRDKFRNMAHAVKGLLKDTETDPESRDVLDRITFLLSMENGFLWDNAYASDQLDDVSRNVTFKAVLTKIHGLVVCHPDDVEPKSKEARRRLTFFVNSLFMNIPDAPSIHDMFSWNVMTPYYSEDVTYTRSDLEKSTDALGVSTLLYLQTLFRSDWNNFLERLGIQDEGEIWSEKNVSKTRTWASIRAQTLERTVNGMMYFEKALRLLADLERLDGETTNDLMGEKFGYVVSCQVYGNMKKNQDPKADDIEQLMHRYPHLRVAYIDNIRLNRAGAAVFYSVLVKSDGHGKIQEIYRVRLPGNPVIGEGKPENQNHAMIFTRGEFLQTIDMNQEGYFEEALKMRNLLQEFAKREGPKNIPTTIIGLREHIFTGSVSSLANYMALQETSFVTLGQRVLAKPLFIRLHYGHPDVFDKLWFITRGGISKSSKGINLSEDIFAGYNNAIRGGQVGFKEYLQVGKGRDVGMSQIYKFEAKLSQGSAEQSLSRDIYRLSNRLDFYRLLSMYYGGIGHYFCNVLTILTIYVVVYLMAVLALFDIEKIGDRVITPMGTVQMLLGGLGLLQTIPLFATIGVERGWWPSLREIFHVFVTGGPLHFMFHIQTKANFMSQTILVGGAKYRATGRGFVTQHTPFDEQFRFFASSHLYLGVELGAGLILMGIYTEAGQYFGRTWSLWLASLSFLASPFWFNPLTFDWNCVVSDYDLWLRWMRGDSGGANKSWSVWWTEENSFYKTMPVTSKFLFVMKSALYLIIAEGIRRSDLLGADDMLDEPTFSIAKVLIVIIILIILSRIFVAKEHALPYPVRRTTGIIISSCLVAAIITLFVEDTDCLRYALAAYYGVGAICQLGLLVGMKWVKHLYFIHDLVCGHILFIPLLVLGALQIPKYIQTWLLYHNALSSDVVVSDILRYARKNQKRQEAAHGTAGEDDLVEQVAELRKIVQKQEQMLSDLGHPSSDAIASLVAPSSEMAKVDIQPDAASRRQPRTMSMSGLDVWGDMALGDLGSPDDGRSNQNMEPLRVQPTQPLSSTGQEFSFTQPDTMPPR